MEIVALKVLQFYIRCFSLVGHHPTGARSVTVFAAFVLNCQNSSQIRIDNEAIISPWLKFLLVVYRC